MKQTKAGTKLGADGLHKLARDSAAIDVDTDTDTVIAAATGSHKHFAIVMHGVSLHPLKLLPIAFSHYLLGNCYCVLRECIYICMYVCISVIKYWTRTLTASDFLFMYFSRLRLQLQLIATRTTCAVCSMVYSSISALA